MGTARCLAILLLLGSPLRAQLVCEPAAIDFGERGHNERPQVTLTLRNAGDSPVTVRELKRSCDCITISPAQLQAPLAPGETAQVQVSMGSGRAMGRLEKHITVLTDSLKRAVEVPVRMRVFEDLEIEPREASVRLWGVVGGQPERASLVVKARGGRGRQPLDLTVKTVRGLFDRPSGKYLRASVESAPEGKRITIELDPRHPEGPISAEVEASLDGKALVIPVSGEMFAWIKISPNYLNFSRIEAADPASSYREVLLTATDDTPFRVTGISTRPYRAGEKTVEIQIEALPAPAGAPGEKSLPAAAPAPAGAEPRPPAPVAPASSTVKLACRAIRGTGTEPSFFGTVTVRTDHPRKPEIVIRYSGFFADAGKRG